MELKMEKCILCADMAEERKYFFKDEPLCFMHFSEYVIVLMEEKKCMVTADEAFSAFEKYKLTLEPTPLTAKQRADKVQKEREAKEKKNQEQKKKKSSRTKIKR